MKRIIIKGGNQLFGSVEIPVAKNSVLPILAATILCEGETAICQVPKLSDSLSATKILQTLGADVLWKDKKVVINCDDATGYEISEDLMQTMRSSIFFLAPLLVRCGKVKITRPGGCDLGDRPIDIHLSGLQALGTTVEEYPDGTVICTAPTGLVGTDYTLRLPSVGATETLIMAAAKAQGTTVLRNVACEPEIIDLADFLIACGANIKGAGTKVITIKGVPKLWGIVYTPIPDRITVATIMCAVALVGGNVKIKSSRPFHIDALRDLLCSAGANIVDIKEGLCIKCNKRIKGLGSLQTGTYPDLATDIAPLLAATLLKSKGDTSINDLIFTNRFICSNEFVLLGADTKIDGSTIHIKGVKELKGSVLEAKDLRGGAALVIAALASKGTSTVTGCEFIERGYEDIAKMFSALGADIYNM